MEGSIRSSSAFLFIKLEFGGSIHEPFAFDHLFRHLLLLVVEDALIECRLSLGSIPSWITASLKVGDDA